MASKEISFLIISDTHENLSQVKALTTYLHNNPKKIDYVIHCGDIVTVPDNQQNLIQSHYRYEPLIKEILLELETLNAQLIYVPGNHEPSSLFKGENSPAITPTSINLHSNIFKLSDDLYMIGVGGSIPILIGENYEIKQMPFSDLKRQNVLWEGFPSNFPGEDNYIKSDDMLNLYLENALNKVKEINPNAQIILLSHIGPLYTWTNVTVYKRKNLFLGSEKIGNLLMEDKNIFVNFHGHSHTAKGVVHLGEGQIVMNPGDLSSGNFGLCTISKKEDDKWEVINTSLNCL